MEDVQKKSLEVAADDLNPISMDSRSMGLWSNSRLWFIIALNALTTLVGLYLVPSMSFMGAIQVVIIGIIFGLVPFTLVGIMGQQTGISTMALTRGAFGINGSKLPSILNIVTLIGWTAIMTEMAGNSLNYISENIFGFSNVKLYIIICMAVLIIVNALETVSKFV